MAIFKVRIKINTLIQGISNSAFSNGDRITFVYISQYLIVLMLVITWYLSIGLIQNN